MVTSRNAEQAEPISTRSLSTVFFATPVMRTVEFTEHPSILTMMLAPAGKVSMNFESRVCPDHATSWMVSPIAWGLEAPCGKALERTSVCPYVPSIYV